MRSEIVNKIWAVVWAKTKTKKELWSIDLWNEYFREKPKFVFNPDVILYGWLDPEHQRSD